jgi:hypothetical protein
MGRVLSISMALQEALKVQSDLRCHQNCLCSAKVIPFAGSPDKGWGKWASGRGLILI